MIKVCMIVNKPFENDPRVLRYADVLAEAGAQVDILCVKAHDLPSGEQRSKVRVFTIPIGRAEGDVMHYLLQYAAAFILFTVRLLALYIRNRYQVIHVHNMPDFLVLTALIPKMLGAKVILDVHDPMTEFFMTKFNKPRTKSILLDFMRNQEIFCAARAHSIITVNSEAMDILINTGIPAGKITVVRNLPDPKMFDRNKFKEERKDKDHHFTLIYPGTIAPRYGLDVAIRALPLLREKIPQLRLVIVGSKIEPPTELVNLAQELGVSSFVQFHPLIPFGEVPRQLSQADVGIYPAIMNPYMNMATPTKVLEYAAMGLPIVASRLTSLEALFPDSALMYFDPGDVQQFADCVLYLFDNPLRRHEMVRIADSIFTRELSWSNEKRVYLNLLNRLLAPGEGIVIMDRNDGQLYPKADTGQREG